MIINKKLNSQNSLKTLVSVIESTNSVGKEHHLSVLDWMLQCNIGGTYTSLNGNRIRCTAKYNLTKSQYTKSIKRLLTSKLIKELGKGSNKINPFYQIHPDIVSLYTLKNTTIHICLE